jgi:carbamoyltransferase
MYASRSSLGSGRGGPAGTCSTVTPEASGTAEVDLIGFSYDPGLVRPAGQLGLDDPWDELRTRYATLAPEFLAEDLSGLDPGRAWFVPHHVAHAASAGLAAPGAGCSVLVCDGRGERDSCLTGRYRGRQLEVLSTEPLPHSLGLMYEELTAHLGFLRSSDEYKVMALASYGKPRLLDQIRESVRPVPGGFRTDPVDWAALAPGRAPGEDWTEDHADLAASVQRRLEEVLLALAADLHAQTGDRRLAMAGGTALNCVANTVLADQGPFEQVWVQPAAGDAGMALGAALQLAADAGQPAWSMTGAGLGRGFTDAEIEAALRMARVPFDRPPDLAGAAAGVLAGDGIVAWLQGRSEYGPRALGHRSLLAHPGQRANLDRLNDIKGREKFRPVPRWCWPTAPLGSSPAARCPARTCCSCTTWPRGGGASSRPWCTWTAPPGCRPSIRPASRCWPRCWPPSSAALECFGSTPVDALAIGPFLVRRP